MPKPIVAKPDYCCSEPVEADQQARQAARTVHGAYGAEFAELRRLMRILDEEQRRVLELVN